MSRPAGDSPLGRRLAEAWYDDAPGVGARVLRSALTPASWAFGAAAGIRGAAYDRGWVRTLRAPVPVVSVGNLAVGGAGKTPVVLALARRLAAAGERPAILTRGYGATTTAPRLVADAVGVHLDADAAGDEPVLLARRAPGTVVLAGRDRAALAARAAGDHGATVCLLDDGLQHRRLHRDLEVVVLDASAPLGNGLRLPAGPLREGPEALARASLAWLSRADDPAPDLDVLLGRLARLEVPVIRSRYRATCLTDLAGAEVAAASDLAGKPVLALSGIARPGSFRRTLEGLGATVIAEARFPDHHRYAEGEIDAVVAEAARQGAAVVTTEKDAVRLPAVEGIRALRIDVEILEGEAALGRALEGIRGR